MQGGWNPNAPGGQAPQQPGTSPQGGGFGAQPGAPQGGGFAGATQPGGGFGAQPGAPQGGGFGAQPGAPQGGGFGAQPSAGGFMQGGLAGLPAAAMAHAPDFLRKGFIGSLLDFSFSNFVLTKLVKVIYALGILGSVLGMLAMMWEGFDRAFLDEYSSVSDGLLQMVMGPIGCVIGIIVSRMMSELLVVQFRIMETLQEINHKTKGG